MFQFSDKLQTSQLHFGFKAKSSTNLCTFVVKEALSYYATNHSNVFCTFLDATKAFDKINYKMLCTSESEAPRYAVVRHPGAVNGAIAIPLDAARSQVCSSGQNSGTLHSWRCLGLNSVSLIRGRVCVVCQRQLDIGTREM